MKNVIALGDLVASQIGVLIYSNNKDDLEKWSDDKRDVVGTTAN